MWCYEWMLWSECDRCDEPDTPEPGAALNPEPVSDCTEWNSSVETLYKLQLQNIQDTDCFLKNIPDFYLSVFHSRWIISYIFTFPWLTGKYTNQQMRISFCIASFIKRS